MFTYVRYLNFSGPEQELTNHRMRLLMKAKITMCCGIALTSCMMSWCQLFQDQGVTACVEFLTGGSKPKAV